MTWNDLQPTTSKKQPETTWNNLQQPTTSKKQPETTWNNLQQARNDLQRWPGSNLQQATNDLKQPTTSKTQPIMTWTYLQWAKKKDTKQQTTSRVSDYFTIWGKWFSSLIHFPPNIWLQSFEHCFTENHGHSSASNISIVLCVFFTGYNIYFFCLGFVSRTLTKYRTPGKGRGYFFCSSLPLPPASQIIWSSAFAVIGEV